MEVTGPASVLNSTLQVESEGYRIWGDHMHGVRKSTERSVRSPTMLRTVYLYASMSSLEGKE